MSLLEDPPNPSSRFKRQLKPFHRNREITRKTWVQRSAASHGHMALDQTDRCFCSQTGQCCCAVILPKSGCDLDPIKSYFSFSTKSWYNLGILEFSQANVQHGTTFKPHWQLGRIRDGTGDLPRISPTTTAIGTQGLDSDTFRSEKTHQ